MYHLKFNFFHIGDQISTTAIPENIFNVTGKKCVVSDPRIWVFKYNPFVVHMTEDEAKQTSFVGEISLIPDCRVPEQRNAYMEMMKCPISNGQTEYMCVNIGFNTVKLRHSRLYVYEDEEKEIDKIVIHTTGSDRTRDKEPAIRYSSGEDSVRIMSDEVIEAIQKNYKGYRFVQVGSKDDKTFPDAIDRRGEYDYWQTAKEIATCTKFIGVNSGPMHIANCYPRVDKRTVLMEYTKETLMTYRPGDVRNWLFSWIDPTNMFFNKFDHDVGLTYSYTKI
jgi:hypothetical protein